MVKKAKLRSPTAQSNAKEVKSKSSIKDQISEFEKEIAGTKYKIINDKIKKNYRDAMGKIKSIREAKELHKHFSKHIRSEGGAFIYTPSENIKWYIN